MAPAASYLPAGLPAPVPEPDGLDAPYWAGTRRGELLVQRCERCRAWQWGPEWICHACLSPEVGWTRVDGRGISGGNFGSSHVRMRNRNLGDAKITGSGRLAQLHRCHRSLRDG